MLSHATYGAESGPTVLVLDGPGSRGLARAAAPAAEALGIRPIAPARPGFRGSPPAPGRRIADLVPDVLALVDGPFGILAQSGGTPYALARGAPERGAGRALVGALPAR